MEGVPRFPLGFVVLADATAQRCDRIVDSARVPRCWDGRGADQMGVLRYAPHWTDSRGRAAGIGDSLRRARREGMTMGA
jgi:hypothetical protein